MKRVKTFLAVLACAAFLATVGSTPVAQADPAGDVCIGDVDGDGRTGVNDLMAVIKEFGTDCSGCPEDITGDGFVGVEDIIEVIMDFGCGQQFCESNEECDDGDPCTMDICIFIKCLNIPMWGCDDN